MEIKDIDELVQIFRDAKISELTVTVGDSTVRLRKPLHAAPAVSTTHRIEKAQAVPSEPESETAPPPIAARWITAPMVGVFHSPGKATAVGSAVKIGQVVGAIESMKLMNEVVSECEGVIAEVGIEDGMAVEYGQRLFRLADG